jgi:hypothetical protein
VRWRFPDKALSFSPWESILTLKAGSLEEYSLLNIWGESACAPASLLLEGCIQSARWLVEASSSFSLSCEPAEITFWQAPSGLRPGERFCMFLRVAERGSKYVRFILRQKILLPNEPPPAPEIWQVGDRIDGVLTCTLTPLSEHYLPVDRASLWQEIAP